MSGLLQRTGLFERADFEALVAGIRSGDVANLLRVAYITGWRIKSELQPAVWPQARLRRGLAPPRTRPQ